MVKKGILYNEKLWLYIREKYNLSARELQVAILLCRGFSNEKMAQSLNIQTGTIKTHLRNLYRSFRVNSKISLVLAIVDNAIETFYVPIKDAYSDHSSSDVSGNEVSSDRDSQDGNFTDDKIDQD